MITENDYKIAAQNAGFNPDEFENKIKQDYIDKPLHPGIKAGLYGKNVLNFKGKEKLSGYWMFLISQLPK